MIKKIVIANLISAGIVTAISIAALPVTVKISEWLIHRSIKENN